MTTLFCMLICGLGLLHGHALQSGDPRALTPTPAPPAPASLATPASSITPPSFAADTSPVPKETTGDDTALQMQIQDALSREPTLNNGSVKVTAVAEGIELSGSVASGRERLNAARIAQSYAHGKKVLNHIVVSGHSTPPVPTPDKVNANHPASFIRPAASAERNSK